MNFTKKKFVFFGLASLLILSGCGQKKSDTATNLENTKQQSIENSTKPDAKNDTNQTEVKNDDLFGVNFSLEYQKIEIDQLNGSSKLKEIIKAYNEDEKTINDELNTFHIIASRTQSLDSEVDIRCEFSNKQFINKKLLKGDTKVALSIKSNLNEFDLKARCYILDTANGTKVEKVKYSFPKRLFLNSKINIGELPFEIIRNDFNGPNIYRISELYFGEKAELITEGKNIEIEATNLVALENSKVMTFEEGAKADKGLNGRNGGIIRMNLKNAEGDLTVILRGEDAGVQSHAAKKGDELPEDPNKNAIAQIKAEECIHAFLAINVNKVPSEPGIGGGSKPRCHIYQIQSGRPAQNGKDGGNGEDGKNGFNGGNSGRLELIIENNNLYITESFYPGKYSSGSLGGKPGHGQPGGKGAKGQGPDTTNHPPGINGIDGKPGKDGADGKNGSKEFICISRNFEENSTCVEQNLKEIEMRKI